MLLKNSLAELGDFSWCDLDWYGLFSMLMCEMRIKIGRFKMWHSAGLDVICAETRCRCCTEDMNFSSMIFGLICLAVLESWAAHHGTDAEEGLVAAMSVATVSFKTYIGQ